MKPFPFALHLIVVFIVGVQYHQIGTFCSSALARPPAYDRFNTSSTTSSSRTHLQQQQTTKTPRTIHRLIAGHLQHNRNRKLQDERINTNTTQLSKLYFRRKPNQLSTTQSSNPIRQNSTIPIKRVESNADEIDDWDSDAALLEDPQDLDNWDNGILRSSAGAGKEIHAKSKKKEDSKKTLSDQVKEGKYGLIEKELFQSPPKRPGIISYLGNKEVPADTKHNLGGLNEDDIWLAEDHLLVLKGGSLNEEDIDEPWEPIDDYQAPSRQIKIPANPKVPPPFPVQFEDNGPIQFIGDHKFTFFYPFPNESVPILPDDGYFPPEGNNNDEKNLLTWSGSPKNSTKNKGGYFYPAPYSPWLINNDTFTNPFLNFGSPQLGMGPNGSFDNSSDYIDEDDPSLYYPPPYSFVYKSNYTSPVPPGPLVPGIVLPPPPNAFARLEEHTTKAPPKEIPFRQVLTKISEYSPKTVVITTSTTPRTTTTTTHASITTITPPAKESIYTVTKPPRPDKVQLYSPPKQPVRVTPPLHKLPRPQADIINFVPKVSSNTDTLSKSNPIYYEYFDARKAPPNQPYRQEYYATTPTTPRPHKKVQVTTVQPIQQPRISKTYLPPKPYNFDDYVYITPRPEIRPNGITNTFVSLKPSYQPIQNFDREVDAIRDTLQYYKEQQFQQNYIPRAPKAKAVYEYSFDASRPNNNFNPPKQYDDEPFQPMVQYSRPVDDANGFKALPYSNADGISTQQPSYYSTTTPVSQQRVRVGSKSYIQPVIYNTTPNPATYPTQSQREYIQRPAQDVQYTTPRPYINNQPWVSIEKQVLQEVPVQTTRQPVHRQRPSSGYSRNVEQPRKQFDGYYYEAPNPAPRQNDKYYQINNHDPFSKQISSIRAKLTQYQQQPIISLENDTYVNYAPKRPPINPDAEFIRPQYFQQYQQLPKSLPQRLPPNRGQYQPISLSRDILVNYRLPLPPINPDSEFIQPQVSNRNTQQYRPVQYRPPVDQQGRYYMSPREVRYRKN